MSTRKKRTELSLEDRFSILKYIDAKVKRDIICEKFKITKSAVSKILKNRRAIEEKVNAYAKETKRARKGELPGLDSALLTWWKVHRAQNVPINGPVLIEKATQFAEQLGLETRTGVVTESWISRFKERHGITFRSVADGEAGDHVDNDIGACGQTPSDDEIVQELLAQGAAEAELLEEEDVEMDVSTTSPNIPTVSELRRSLDLVRVWTLANVNSAETCSNICTSLSLVENEAQKLHLTSMRQTSIQDYFRKIK